MGQYTRTNIINRVSTVLSDTSTAIWGTALIDSYVDPALLELSKISPHWAKATLTTSSGTKTIDISSLSTAMLNTQSIESVEFRVGDSGASKDPPRFRNFYVTQGPSGDLLHLDIDFFPSAGETVLVTYRKPHTVDSISATVVSATNTLNYVEEESLVHLIAARLAIDTSVDYVNNINLGGGGAARDYQQWGYNKLQEIKGEFRHMRSPRIVQDWCKED
ncbi:MAG: hypothetical protein SVK08_11140 [Halobacteriota archaeon]|nr:hypothetical protein [Halobacteriota archaeon]